MQNPVGPDYIITNFTYPAIPQDIGTSGTANFKVKNKGSENGTNTIKVSLYLSPYAYFDNNNNILLNSLVINALNAGNSSPDQSLGYQIPANAIKTSYLLLKIDATDKEADIFNNVSSSSAITVANGSVLRTLLYATAQSSTFTIGTLETQYFKFSTVTNHAYQIYWDDYSEGPLALSPTAANVKVSSTTSDLLTTFFSLMDNGFNVPQTVFSTNGSDIYVDATTSGTGGQYAIRIADVGIRPDLSITINPVANKVGGVVTSVTFNYIISNLSTFNVQGFTFKVGCWLNPNMTPTPNLATDFTATLSGINIGPGANITGSLSPIGVQTLSNGTAYAYVDFSNDIVESNESNNLSPGVAW